MDARPHSGAPSTSQAGPDLRRELLWAGLSLAGALALGLGEVGSAWQMGIPAGATVVPVVALALAARPWVTILTGLIAVTTVVLVWTSLGAVAVASTSRIAAGYVGVAVAGVLSAVRVAREQEATERSREAAERESEARVGRWLSLVVDSSGMGTWEWRVGAATLRTRGMGTLLGVRDESQVTPEYWRSLLDDQGREDWIRTIRASLDLATPIQVVQRVRLRRGDSRWLEVRADPLVDASGTVVGLVGTATDVTERVEAEEEDLRIRAMVTEVMAAGTMLATCPDLESFSREACRRAREIFDVDAASLWLVGDDGSAELAARSPAAGTVSDSVPIDRVLSNVPSSTGTSTRILRRGDVAPHVTLPSDAPQLGLACPILAGGRVVMYLGMSWLQHRDEPGRRWLSVVDRFATQVAIARSLVVVREAQAESTELSRRLQQGLAPSRLHCHGGWRVSMLYRAGERRMTLGGDFLDTWTDGDDRMAFVLGDVCGHGPEQAALGVMLRSAWMGMVSAGERDPATLTERLQDIIELRRTQDSVFTTLVTGILDPGGRTVDLVCAGHPPPMAVSSSARYLATRAQLPIGVVSGSRYLTDRLRLGPDEGLLVFSDGLFESKQPVVGLDGLRDLVAELRPTGDADLERLVSSVERRQGAVDDDVAVLLIDR